MGELLATGFLAALGASAGTDPVAHLNPARPLLLLDTFEELGKLNHYGQGTRRHSGRRRWDSAGGGSRTGAHAHGPAPAGQGWPR